MPNLLCNSFTLFNNQQCLWDKLFNIVSRIVVAASLVHLLTFFKIVSKLFIVTEFKTVKYNNSYSTINLFNAFFNFLMFICIKERERASKEGHREIETESEVGSRL